MKLENAEVEVKNNLWNQAFKSSPWEQYKDSRAVSADTKFIIFHVRNSMLFQLRDSLDET